ncbi:NAD(P)-binding protein [Paraburkholderia sp. MM5384-R2]|uniref:NAD(P)-binding protein n=1 Tax=unclassified Paraburkholderia TaxID=2615204 RepID=UPI0028897D1C|nr:NAD(P)-binding protein [Paraburkholderia sp. MM5384-R2]
MAIVGAGLRGLALARVLHAQDVSVVVIEGREREGGRADAMLRSHASIYGQMPFACSSRLSAVARSSVPAMKTVRLSAIS